ncbi:MAG: hypothetical protein QOK02_1587, partial [Mycobacterium sp.]|nr:hypothetical protein [Mycobacterium sp.]
MTFNGTTFTGVLDVLAAVLVLGGSILALTA